MIDLLWNLNLVVMFYRSIDFGDIAVMPLQSEKECCQALLTYENLSSGPSKTDKVTGKHCHALSTGYFNPVVQEDWLALQNVTYLWQNLNIMRTYNCSKSLVEWTSLSWENKPFYVSTC